MLQAYIATGTPLVKGPELFCGTFFVDSIDFSGPPRTVSIRAVSIPLNKSIRRLVKSRAWEKQNISAIAKKIADAAKLELFFDSDDDPVFDRQDQSRESDLKFLSRLCSENGLSVKVTDTQLVVFSKEKYEKKDPVATIAVGQAELLSFRFSQSHSETYRSVTVSYRNPKVKKKNSAGGEMFDKYGRPTKAAVAARSGMFDEHGRLINKKRQIQLSWSTQPRILTPTTLHRNTSGKSVLLPSRMQNAWLKPNSENSTLKALLQIFP